ncbi:MAG: Thiol-disulfide oxidoreductase ResA [Rhodocyclaceae bacterium]|nr:Thiol-disulfide oxidoreductase ResA [Rhodocyclaceae bacterium]
MNARVVLPRLLLAAIAIAAAALGLWFGQRQHPPPSAPNVASETELQAVERLFELVLPDADGQTRPFSQWRGKVLVVNFWATWCPPCREEMPAFSRLHTRYADRGVQFVGLAIDEAEKVRAFRRETGTSYPLLIGNSGTLGLAGLLGNAAQGLPFTIALDRQGRLIGRKLGVWKEAELERLLQAQLAPN